MITCVCSKKIIHISEMIDVRSTGLVLYGNCPKCGLRQSAMELWRRTSVVKGLSEIKKERKPRKSKKLVSEV